MPSANPGLNWLYCDAPGPLAYIIYVVGPGLWIPHAFLRFSSLNAGGEELQKPTGWPPIAHLLAIPHNLEFG